MDKEKKLKFGVLLSDGIQTVKECEGKKISIILDEVGYALGYRGGSTIERWKAGHPPKNSKKIEQLVHELMQRSCNKLTRNWLEALLQSAQHPYPEAVCNQFFPSVQKEAAQISINISHPSKPKQVPEIKNFVGREKELTGYLQSLKEKRFAVICGMPGVGKTTIANKCVNTLGEITRVFWYQFRENRGLDNFIDQFANFLAWHEQPALWEILKGVVAGGGRLPPVETRLNIIRHELQGKDFLMYLDDFQFAEDDFRLTDFLENLLEDLKENSVRILIVSRKLPTFVLHSETEILRGLSEQETKILFQGHNQNLDASQFSKLYTATQGNPMFLILAINALRDRRDATGLIDRLAETDDVKNFLNETVHARLSRREGAVMEALSCLLGFPGTRDAIEATLNSEDIYDTIEDLLLRNLIVESVGENGREFWQHNIIQDYYYSRLGSSKRKRYHQRAGEFYEHEETDYLKAGQHYIASGEMSLAQSVLAPHIGDLINEGQSRPLLSLLEKLETENFIDRSIRIIVRLAMAQIMMILGERDNAEETLLHILTELDIYPNISNVPIFKARAYRGLGELLEQESSQDAKQKLQDGLAVLEHKTSEAAILEQASLLAQLGTVEMHAANYNEARQAFAQSLSIIPDDAPHLRCNVLKNLGAINFILGHVASAQEFTQQALRISRFLLDHLQTASILINSGVNKMVIGDWPGGIADFEYGLEIANRIGSEKTRASLETNLGIAYANTADDELALEHLNKGLVLARQTKLHQIETIILLRLAEFCIQNSDWEQAENYLADGNALALKIGAKGSLTAMKILQAQTMLGKGQLNEAYEMIEEALDNATKLGEPLDIGIGQRVKAQILSGQGEHSLANEVFGKGISTLTAVDVYETAKSHLAFGTALLNAGKRNQGKKHIDKAKGAFNELGAKRELAVIEELLKK